MNSDSSSITELIPLGGLVVNIFLSAGIAALITQQLFSTARANVGVIIGFAIFLSLEFLKMSSNYIVDKL
jgi:hypothetical protein